ncbi:Ribonuclease H-like protein [Apiospora arundinis]|uniref:Ribonuclease H-like protein n=1 Tax=Apiospora arundinis TaxID=335852 RepID=A0ABR2I980_9PEZI
MARPQNRKRPLADDRSQDSRRHKKIKSNFSPAFWDNLSKVSLTPRALREFDRRNNIETPAEPTTPEKSNPEELARLIENGGPDLRKSAKHGGPDLRDLRGCSGPRLNTMAARHSSQSSRSSRRTQTTDATSISRRSSAYNEDFERHLYDNNIYLPHQRPTDNRRPTKPENISDILPRLSTSRPSLSPSRFNETVFEEFQEKNEAKSEGTVMRNVIPMITGNAAGIFNESDLHFTNFTSMTDETTVKPVPDFFDGARLGDVHPHVRRDLDQKILPTKHVNAPVAPNFYLEAKGPKGGADVARRQACYDGAHGARAMHSLQNYGQDEVAYNNNASTFSSTYHAGTGTLALFSHHITAPAAEEERPNYHMTQLKAYALTSDFDTFRGGLAAFRNLRDLAQEDRDGIIQEANGRARAYVDPQTQGEEDIPEAEHEDASSAEEIVDYNESDPFNAGRSEYSSAETYTAGSVDLNGHDTLGSSQAHLAAHDGDGSFTTSFTPSFTSHTPNQSHTKRLRQSSTPPSAREGETGKRRRPPNSRTQVEDKPAHGTRPETSGSDESTWVNTYKRQGHVCFTNLQNQEIKTSRKDWKEQQADGVGRCHYWQSPKSGRTFWTRTLP